MPTMLRERPVAVLTPDAELPEWAREWGRRCSASLRAVAVPYRDGSGPAAVAEEVRRPGALAGEVVLVPRPPVRRALPARVVAAVHELPDDAPVLAWAAECARGLGGEVLVVHAVPYAFAERSLGVDAAVQRGRATLAAACSWLRTEDPGLPAVSRLARGWPHEFLGERLDADLLVVGGPRPAARGALGRVATDALHHAPCPSCSYRGRP